LLLPGFQGAPPPELGYFEAAVLGAVQGLTEFLPVSSTAHMEVVPQLFGWRDPGAANSAVIQLGTTAALLVYYARELGLLGLGALAGLRGSTGNRRDLRLLAGIGLGTIPIVVCGLLFKGAIETSFRSLWVVASALALGAVVMGIADRVASRPRRAGETPGLLDAVLVGVCQAFALVPGVSRSGATLTGAFFLGFDRASAARFSFLLSIPAVLAAGLYQLAKQWPHLSGAGLGPLVAAVASAAVVGYASLDFLLRFLRTHSLVPFVAYRIALAVFLAGLISTGRLSAATPN
jgi:undecaprenyl-diphosphatase